MKKYFLGDIGMYIRRIDYFIVSLVMAISITILGLVAIDLMMLAVVNNFNVSENNWLLSILYIVMNVVGVTFLSKFVIVRFSPLNPIVYI